MNLHERRRMRDIGLAFLSNAVADVLAEAKQERLEGWLTADQVRVRLGFDHGQYASGLCRGILNQMYLNGEVEFWQDEGSNFVWRLAG